MARGRKKGDLRVVAQRAKSPDNRGFASVEHITKPQQTERLQIESTGVVPSESLTLLQNALNALNMDVVSMIKENLHHKSATIQLRAADVFLTWWKHCMPQVKELRSSEQRYGELPPPDWD